MSEHDPPSINSIPSHSASTSPKKSRRPIKSKIETTTPANRLAVITTNLVADVDSARELFNIVVPLLVKQDTKRDNDFAAFAKRLKRNKTATESAALRPKEILDSVQSYAYRRGRANRLFRSMAVVSLVSRFDQFLSEVLEVVLSEYPDRLKSSDKKLTYGEAVTLSSIEDLKARFISEEIDAVMRDSHESQLCYLDKQLKISNLKDQLGTWPQLLEVTERRNMCVHGGAVASKRYIDICTEAGVEVSHTKVGNSLLPSVGYYDETCDMLVETGVKIGQLVSRKVAPQELREADAQLNNVGYRLLDRGPLRNRARRIFDFGASMPPKLVSDDAYRRMFLINKSIALKALGKIEEVRKMVDSVDWSATSPKFRLAIEVLQGDFKKAERTMASMRPGQPITEDEFLYWPLF